MKQVLLVEPHPDDICLSLFHFVNRIKANYCLMSVFSNDERKSDVFCERMKMEWCFTKPIEDVVNYEHRIPPHIIKAKPDSYGFQRSHYVEQHEEDYIRIKRTIAPVIQETGCETIMTTLGLLHPLHVLVSVACEELARVMNRSLVYYADFPYASRKYGEKIIHDSGLKSFEIYDEKSKNYKIAMFEECYPTEKGILRWDREFITNHHEMIFFFKENKNEGFGSFSWR